MIKKLLFFKIKLLNKNIITYKKKFNKIIKSKIKKIKKKFVEKC